MIKSDHCDKTTYALYLQIQAAHRSVSFVGGLREWQAHICWYMVLWNKGNKYKIRQNLSTISSNPLSNTSNLKKLFFFLCQTRNSTETNADSSLLCSSTTAVIAHTLSAFFLLFIYQPSYSWFPDKIRVSHKIYTAGTEDKTNKLLSECQSYRGQRWLSKTRTALK